MLTLSLSSTIVSGADSDCPVVHTIVEWVCRDACGTELMYQVCMEALRLHYPTRSVNEIGEYPELAARQAYVAYSHTREFALYLRHNASLSGEEKAAYDFCDKSYDAAKKAMDNVYQLLPDNCFKLADMYKAALHGLEACRDRLAKLPSSPLLAMVKVDLNKTLLPYSLSKLLGVK